MARCSSINRLPARLAGLLLLALSLMGMPPITAHASGMTVTAFYTVSKGDTQPWYANGSAPRRTSTFPSKVDAVYYCVQYTGATPGVTEFQVKVYDAKGSLVIDGYRHTLKYADGSYLNNLTNMPDGVFRIDLLVDGSLAGHTAFSVGRPLGAVITGFFTADGARFDGQGNLLGRRPSTHYPAITTTITFYYRYTGATPRVTHFTLTFYHPAGTFYGTADLGRADKTAGWVIPTEDAPGKKPYPVGSYRVDLLVDGHVGASTTFTIDPGPGIVITTFYTADKAAYEAWIHTTSTAAPRKTGNFPSHVRQIACYFAYKGAKPGITTYKAVVSEPEGPSASAGPYTFRYASGYAMVLVTLSRPSGFDMGFGDADLYVDGQEVAHADVNVGL